MRFNHPVTFFIGLLFCSVASAQQTQFTPITGATTGTVTGLVESSNGAMVAPQAAVQATIFAKEYADGRITASFAGTAACTGDLGIAFEFIGEYDMATESFVGKYSDKPGQLPDKDIKFNNTGGLNWSASISGRAPSPGGLRAYELEVAVSVPPSAMFISDKVPADYVYGGNLNRTELVQVPVNIPLLGLSQTLSMEIDLVGQWSAVAIPLPGGGQKFAGQASGNFKTREPKSLTFAVPMLGQQTVTVDFEGHFSGTLFYVSDNEVAFKGSWVTQSADQDFGGDINISIPFADISNFPYTIAGTLGIKTGIQQMPLVQVPFSFNGQFPLNLTASP